MCLSNHGSANAPLDAIFLKDMLYLWKVNYEQCMSDHWQALNVHCSPCSEITGALNHPLCWFEGVSCALLPQSVSSMMCSAFWKTFTLDPIMCLHAAPASLYLSLFSLSEVDIRKKKGQEIDKLEKEHKFLDIATAYRTKEWGDSFFHKMNGGRITSLCHLIWRLRLTLLSFVFLSLQHNRVCLAVSTLSK